MQPIFVGDVQGCVEELDLLLARARREHGDDFTLYCVGDLVNRGPESYEVLARVRERIERGRAHTVLGNHELALVARYLGLRAPSASDTLDVILERPDAGEWIDWLRRRPIALLDALGERRFALVHAAVGPGWTWQELARRAAAAEARLAAGDLAQLARFLDTDPLRDPVRDDLARITSCRSVTTKGFWSSRLPTEIHDGRPWHEAWRRNEPDYGVVYGHWALQRLHLADGLRGLDTGCVHHGAGSVGALTAWLPDLRRADPFALPDRGFWTIPAQRSYRSAAR